MLLKKTPATRNAAQKELTPPEEFLDLAKRPCTGKKFTIRKNAAPETTPTRLMLGRTMNSKTCYTRDHTKKPNERSNAKLSGGVAVRLSAGLERGSAVNDEHEKNTAPDAYAVVQILERITVLEPFTVEQRP